MKITEDIRYIGVNDHTIDLFEGQYIVPNGMAYNSYVILDDKIVVMDTVDGRFVSEWLENLEKALAGQKPDYLVVQHMEPDHSAGICRFMEQYPKASGCQRRRCSPPWPARAQLRRRTDGALAGGDRYLRCAG